MSVLTEAVGMFRSAFPYTPLRLYVEALGAVIEPVLQGTCQIGVIGTLPVAPASMNSEPLIDVPMVTSSPRRIPCRGTRASSPRTSSRSTCSSC